jgi:diacylglycerol kinase (ATP)
MPVASQPETIQKTPPAALAPSISARRVLISMNPRAGARCRQPHIREIGNALERAGFDVRTTGDLTELAELSTQGCSDGDLRAVIAAGGDGTASVVRNHVPLAVPLLPVPLGTENLLGRFAGQGVDAAAVVRTIEEGVVVGLDLPRANGKHFLLMISAGFDAEVIRTLHENRRGNIRRTAYVLPTLQALSRYGYPEMRLHWQDETSSGQPPLNCRWLFGFNLPLYALGLPIAADAVATDGMLDVCAFERGAVWSILRYLWHITRRSHSSLPDTTQLRSHHFRVESADGSDVAYQLDGDHGGQLPVDVEVLAGGLRLLVSGAAAVQLGFALPHEHRLGKERV